MGSSRKRAKSRLSPSEKNAQKKCPPKSTQDTLAGDACEYNKGLGDIRRSLQTIPRPSPRTPRKFPSTYDKDYWLLPYQSTTEQNTNEDQPSKRFIRVKQFSNVQYEVREAGFVCPGCCRELPVSKRFARKMCQACYKRYLKTHQGVSL